MKTCGLTTAQYLDVVMRRLSKVVHADDGDRGYSHGVQAREKPARVGSRSSVCGDGGPKSAEQCVVR